VKVSVEKLPNSEAVLEVDVTWDEMEKASEKAYRKIVKQIDVQGFRRGKAPRSIVERKVGKEAIYQEGLDELISEIYRNTLKEHELTPITQPKLDAPSLQIGQPYHFMITVPIITPVELSDYRQLHFEREEPAVTSEEVDQELERLRNRAATWQSVERSAEYGDRVTVNLKLTVGEQNVSDLQDNPFELTNERVGLFSGMDEHIVGMQAGESKSFTTTIPTDYGNEKLAGQEAHYEVTLHKVEAKQLPALDDAFAVQASEGEYATLEDYSKFLSDDMLANKKRRARNELRDNIVNAIIDESEFVVHPALIDAQAEDMLHQFSHLLEQQHISLDQYLMMARTTHEEYLQSMRPDAEKSVKRQLMLDAVARQEHIGIDPQEIEAVLQLYSQAGQPLPNTEDQVRALAINYRREKTLNFLVDLVAGPDPESELATSEEEEVASIDNALVAAQAAEAASDEAQDMTSEAAGESAIATPPPEEASEPVQAVE